MLLAGKNAVVTGCLRGIGRQTLVTLAEHGASIWACAQAPDPEFEEACAALAARAGVWVKPVYFDLTDAASVKAAMRAIQGDRLPVDILVNVAGYTRDAIFQMTSMEQLKLIFEVNFFSQVFITQAVTKVMAKQGRGSVVNISSISAIDGNAGQFAYSASKAALLGATKTLSRELAPQGIRVNAVAPGVIDTTMNAAVPVALIADRIKTMSVPRMGTDAEVAKVILFLASDLSSYMTGQVIRVDGGMK